MLHLRDALQLQEVISQTISRPNYHLSLADTDTRLKTRKTTISHLQYNQVKTTFIVIANG